MTAAPAGASGVPAALLFCVAPLLLLAAALGLRGSGRVNSGAAVVARLRPYVGAARAAAEAEGVPLALVLAVASAESGGRPDARSHRDAVGLMQLREDTADELAARRGEPRPDRGDPATSLRLGARYLAQQFRRYAALPDPRAAALAAYNAGPGNVDGWLRDDGTETQRRGIETWVRFAETRAYLERVTWWERRWALELGASALR